MILAIVFAYLAYKRASANGRNGILWALIAVAAFIGTQLVVGLGIGLFIGIGVAAWGWQEDVFETYAILINIVAIIFSIGAGWLVLKFLDRPPAQDVGYSTPPPPPDFRGGPSAEPESFRQSDNAK
jgi:hypothetical protein